MIDQAIAAQPAIVLYALRVQSALAAQRSDAVVESIWEYGHGLFTGNTLDRAQLRGTLQELLQLLNKQAAAGARVAEVRTRLLDDIRELARHVSDVK
jgi:hypothetical protein